MNRLSIEKRTQAVSSLVEGSSINAACRMHSVAKHTVLKLLKDIGCAVGTFHDLHVRNLAVRGGQGDEIGAFCNASEKNVPVEKRGQFGYGDVRTWTAIDADSKPILSYTLGTCGAETANAFHAGLSWVNSRIQITLYGRLKNSLAYWR